MLSLPAGSKTTIYLKYGKADAVSASDPLVAGKKIASVASNDAGDSGDFGGNKAVAVATTIGTFDDSVSAYAGAWNANILTRDLIFLYGRTNAEVITALNNGAIVVLPSGAYNSLKAYLGSVTDKNYTSRGFTTNYFAYSKGYVLGAMETGVEGCDWEHYSSDQMSSRGLNIRDTILQFPNVGLSGSDIYLGLTIVPVYFSLYLDKSTSSSLSGWEYRNEIQIDNTQGSSLTNYQVKVNFTADYEDFWQRCRSDGFDVRFVDEDNTTILNAYRVSFNYANKTAAFWVKVPSIQAGTIKNIYLYYGNSAAADFYGLTSSFDNTLTKDFQESGFNVSAVGLNGTTAQKVTVNQAASLNITSAVTLEANVKYTADTWLPGFGYRKKITLNNLSGPALTGYTLKFDVNYVAGKMNADYSDLRFVDTAGADLDYKVSLYNGTKATVLVNLPLVPASSNKDIYVYYGNTSAVNQTGILAAKPLDATMFSSYDASSTGGLTTKGFVGLASDGRY
ncbi:MAG: DUF2341 domain-containing protein, partial [Candidatus Omnitrophica bacterium]|nr:DUF2341 domain-containing protein [Candidatus Omnitrophota bacterium]